LIFTFTFLAEGKGSSFAFHCALLANDIQIMTVCVVLELDQGGISLVVITMFWKFPELAPEA
jgi:hypothetical protein